MMERFKKAVKDLFFKPYWMTILICIPGYLSVAYVLMSGLERSVYGAAAYALSSYALILSGTAVYRIVKIIKVKITGHRLWKRYRTDLVFRTKISLFCNTAITVIFVLLKLAAGFYNHSIWMVALGIYYVCLLILRVSLLYRVFKSSMVSEKEREIKVSRVYGFFLLMLDIALCGIVLFSLYRGAQFSYPGYLIYAMAAYAFYAVIVAVIGFYKNHRDESAVIIALNILKLTTSLVALFALETAMLATFGGETSLFFRQCMIAATGFVIIALVFGMAFYLIIHFHLVNGRKSYFKE